VVGAAGLPITGGDLRESLFRIWFCFCRICEDLVDRHAGQPGGHVEQRALVQGRHELGAQPRGRPDRGRRDQHRRQDGGEAMAQHEVDHRPVGGDQPAVQRVLLLRQDAAADQGTPSASQQRHASTARRRAWRRSWCRPAARQAAFLGSSVNTGRKLTAMISKQRANRTAAGPHLAAGGEDRLDARALVVLVACRRLEVLVRVLDHHHAGVDHLADGDGDCREAHDVRVDAEQLHADEREQHAERQHQDHHQGAARVQQEQHADQGDDQRLLAPACRSDVSIARRISSERSYTVSIVTPSGRPAFRCSICSLTPSIHLQRRWRRGGDDDAGDDLAFAVSVRPGRARSSGRVRRAPRRGMRTGVPPEAVSARSSMSAALRAGSRARAPCTRPPPSRPPGRRPSRCWRSGSPRRCGRRVDAVGAQPRRVDDHLVLLHEAADRATSLTPGAGIELVAQVPVLQASATRPACGPSQAPRTGRPSLPRVASGPSCGVTFGRQPPGGAVQYSSTRERASNRSVPSSRSRRRSWRRRTRSRAPPCCAEPPAWRLVERERDLVLDHLRRLAGHLWCRR